MKPICHFHGYALWFSPNEELFYWQSDGGTGDYTSQGFKTRVGAIRSAHRGKLKMRK